MTDVAARESSAGACPELTSAVREARSDDELQRRLDEAWQARTLDTRCMAEIERDPAVTQLRQRQHQALAMRARDEARELRARHALSGERIQQNELVRTARQQGANARRQPEQFRPPPSAPQAPSADGPTTPSLAGIVPETIVPGTEIVVYGSGFGQAPGNVRISVHGQWLNAAVLHWTQDMVIATLGEDTAGLTQDSYATFELARADGPSTTRSLVFYPLYEAAVFVTALQAEMPFSPGTTTETILFMGETLNEPWKVQAVHVDGVVGQCEPAPPPAASFGDSSLATRLRLTSPSANPGLCMLTITAIGPKGIAHGISAESALP